MPKLGAARRTRRRRVPPMPLPYWVVALACAAIAAAVVGGLASRAATAAQRWGPQTSVAVATRDLPRGHVIDEADVEARAWPVALVPGGGAARSPVGRIVTESILSGEVVAAARLAPGGLSPVAALLPPHTRAVALPAGPATVPLAVGDHVDVLAAAGSAPTDGAPAAPARLLSADCAVVAIDDQAATIAIPERDAGAVVDATVAGVAVLALRDGLSGSSSPTG